MAGVDLYSRLMGNIKAQWREAQNWKVLGGDICWRVRERYWITLRLEGFEKHLGILLGDLSGTVSSELR